MEIYNRCSQNTRDKWWKRARNAGGMCQGDGFGRMCAFFPLIFSSATINGILPQTDPINYFYSVY